MFNCDQKLWDMAQFQTFITSKAPKWHFSGRGKKNQWQQVEKNSEQKSKTTTTRALKNTGGGAGGKGSEHDEKLGKHQRNEKKVATVCK